MIKKHRKNIICRISICNLDKFILIANTLMLLKHKIHGLNQVNLKVPRIVMSKHIDKKEVKDVLQNNKSIITSIS